MFDTTHCIFTGSLVLSLSLLSACDGPQDLALEDLESSVAEHSRDPAVADELAQPLAEEGQGTYDDLMIRITREVPEFGGFFFQSAEEVAYVWLTSDSPDALRRAQDVIQRHFSLEPRNGFRALQADFDFIALKRVHHALGDIVAPIPGVVSTDVDDMNNIVSVGVATAEAREAVLTAARAADIDPGTFDVVDEELVELNVKYLRDRVRPMVGGLRLIRFHDKAACTYGFTAIRAGTTGFVTASHCTGRDGVSWNGVSQPKVLFDQKQEVDPWVLIGEESVDPLPSVLPSCPVGHKCRYSDAAFVRGLGVLSNFVRRIAETPMLDWWDDGAINTEIVATWPVTKKWADLGSAKNGILYPGQIVMKTGSTTGRRSASVNAVGKTITWGSQKGITYTFLDQIEANGLNSKPGDSGGPVYVEVKPSLYSPNKTHTLVGILWGAPGRVSPIWGIQKELGALTVCENGSC